MELRVFFLRIKTLPTFRAERIWMLRLYFLFFLVFQISGCPGPQISRNLDWAGPGPEIAGAPSAAALRQLRTTKLVRSKELGQHCESPMSASPFWGTSKTARNSMILLPEFQKSFHRTAQLSKPARVSLVRSGKVS